MVSLEKLLDRKKEASGLASAQIRTLALGFLAISWALLTAHDEPLRTMSSHVNRYLLLGLAVSGVLATAFDVFQYVAVTVMAGKAAEEAEAAASKTAQYDKDSFAWKAQAWFFRAKFVVVVIGSAILAVIFWHLFAAV
jgi:hypothetical protein